MEIDDLCSARDKVRGQQRSACSFIEESVAAAQGAAAAQAFLHLDIAAAREAARQADAAVTERRDPGALAGLAVSVKDLFDVQGQVTTAGSKALFGTPPALRDAPAVARLRAAGAALIGRTQMTEFAFSGVGINPHHGTPANVPMARLGAAGRIPGGSSSGAAVSVACGAAFAALGSDTGGSIRIPAALQGLVGFKNTQRLTPTAGTVPLSPSLDTACAITRSVRDAVLLHEVLAARTVRLLRRPLPDWRLAVATGTLTDDLQPHVAQCFERALRALAHAGARVTEIALPELQDIGALLVKGGLAAAESWAWHQPLLSSHAAEYDPRVLARIRRGAEIDAAGYRELQAARSRWIAAMGRALEPFDAVLSPTVPLTAPPIADLAHDDAEFFRVNALLLRNPAVVNQLDGCAVSLPCHCPGEAPVGLMLWSVGGRDDALLDLAGAVEPLVSGQA
ncbi:MAG TPA: amidase [Burkholderiaceae bacterium]|nr:amidase [Burkholderiaceae bacterium]